MNPFALFDLPLNFDLDENALKNKYLQQQKRLHPDNFTQADAQTQRLAIQQSAQLNDAYLRLKDPVLRAESLILAYDPSILEMPIQHDSAFLFQQMQWREELEMIEKTQDLAGLDSLTETINKAFCQQSTVLRHTLESQHWLEAKQQSEKLRFLQKLQQEIAKVEDTISDF